MTTLDWITAGLAGYSAFVVSALYFKAYVVLGRRVAMTGFGILPLFLLPFIVLADLIVRAAS